MTLLTGAFMQRKGPPLIVCQNREGFAWYSAWSIYHASKTRASWWKMIWPQGHSYPNGTISWWLSSSTHHHCCSFSWSIDDMMPVTYRLLQFDRIKGIKTIFMLMRFYIFKQAYLNVTFGCLRGILRLCCLVGKYRCDAYCLIQQQYIRIQVQKWCSKTQHLL